MLAKISRGVAKIPGVCSYCPCCNSRKVGTYVPASHLFCPVAIETLGAMGPQSLALIKDIGRRIASETGESRAGEYLLQRLSVAIRETLQLCWGPGVLVFDCFIITIYLLI